MKGIDKDFIIHLLTTNQKELSNIYYLIEQYIFELKNKEVKIGGSNIIDTNMLDVLYSFSINYYMNKFSIVRLFDKNKKLIGVF